MAGKQPQEGHNRPRLALHVPEPRFRPGDHADFSYLKLPEAGAFRHLPRRLAVIDARPQRGIGAARQQPLDGG